MPKSRNHISEEEFQRYLKNQMTETERNAFERELQKHPFEDDALSGFQQISPDELSNDLNELKSRISRKKPVRNYRIWVAAATFLLLISTGILWFQLKDNNPLPKLTETKTIEKQENARTLETEISNEKSGLNEDSTIQALEMIDNYADVQTEAKAEPPTRKILTPKKSGMETETVPLLQQSKGKSNTDAASQENMQLRNEREIMIRGVSDQAAGKDAKAAMPSSTTDDHIATNAIEVKGKVISLSDNQPLPGAVIQQKGTTNGTIADKNGNFALKMNNESENAVVVSFVGMDTQEFQPTSDSVKIIGLESSQLALEEIVVAEKVPDRKKQTAGYVTAAKPILDSPAQPIGGMDKFQLYLEKMAVLEENYSSRKVGVKVKIKFNSDGEITGIENLNNADADIFERTVKIIQDGPEWTPEFKNGVNIESERELKIIFRKKK